METRNCLTITERSLEMKKVIEIQKQCSCPELPKRGATNELPKRGATRKSKRNKNKNRKRVNPTEKLHSQMNIRFFLRVRRCFTKPSSSSWYKEETKPEVRLLLGSKKKRNPTFGLLVARWSGTITSTFWATKRTRKRDDRVQFFLFT